MSCFYKRFRFVCPICILLIIFLSPVTEANKQNAKAQPFPAATDNKKVDQALDMIQNATSYKAVSMELKKLNLNKKEQQLLAEKGRQQPYSGIIQRLIAIEKKTTRAALEKKYTPRLMQLKNQDQQKQQQTLRRLNQQVAAKVSTLKSRTLKTVTRLIPQQTVIHEGIHPDTSSGPMANITNVSPQPSIPGSLVTIRGEHLGSTTQNVYLVINRERVSCPVESWSNTRVVVTIPRSVETLVGESEKTGSIYIALPRYSHTLRVAPEPSSLVPSVSALSGTSIRPGQVLVIEGDHFLTERRGTVTFRFNSRDINGRVTEWENRYIVVTMPDDIGGLPEVAGTLNVRNHAGNDATRSITFMPTLVTKSILNYHVTSATWFVGSKKMFEDNRINLLNGWTVKEYWLGVDVGAWGGG